MLRESAKSLFVLIIYTIVKLIEAFICCRTEFKNKLGCVQLKETFAVTQKLLQNSRSVVTGGYSQTFPTLKLSFDKTKVPT